MITVNAEALADFVRDIFVAAGSSDVEGRRVGRYLVGANLTGHDSHGVARVPRYVQWRRDALIHADQTVEAVVDTPVLAVLDGKYGFGQTVAPQAVEIGIAKCKAMGLSAIALRHSGHVGRVGDWAEMAAAAGLVSLHFVNVVGSMLVAPFGGVERRLSTAPCCIGVPRPGADPIVLDFATSLVAEGKVLVASQGGKPIPDDALIGPDGEVTGDPRLMYGDYEPGGGARDNRKGIGALRTFGEHKGSGLAVMCELLGGALTGNGANAPGRRWANGMLSFYVDPAVLDPELLFPAEVSRYFDYLKSAKPAKPGGEVLMPGEPEQRMRAERLKTGIPLPPDTWAALLATAASVGVNERAPDVRSS
jgi:hydroxycarboxylate dehydrogenase B